MTFLRRLFSSKPKKICSRHPDGGHLIYKRISLFAAIPIIIVLTATVFMGKAEKPREPFVPYEFLRRRTKRFPWGDGQKSLFHNDHTNPLPDGYVTEGEEYECDE